MRDKKIKKAVDANLKSCRAIRCKVGSLYHMDAGHVSSCNRRLSILTGQC